MRAPLVALALSLCVSRAHAEVKYNVAVVPAIGYHRNTLGFDGTLVGAAMFGAPNSSASSFGPRVEVGTFAFDTLRFALGPSIHVPVEPLALGFAVHVSGNNDSDGLGVGIGARGFLGFRPYNHYGPYAATGGITLGVDQWFGLGPSFMVGAQLDAMWLSIPVLALAELFRG